MLEKISQTAEKIATSASRRQFLGRLGQGALTLAAALGALLVVPGAADAARRGKTCGPNSDFDCQGRLTGDACANGAGTCQFIPKRYNVPGGCYCRIKARRG